MNLKLYFGDVLDTGIIMGIIKVNQIKYSGVIGVRFIFCNMLITQKILDELEDLKFSCTPSGDLFIGVARRWLKRSHPSVTIVMSGKPTESRNEIEAIIPTPFGVGG